MIRAAVTEQQSDDEQRHKALTIAETLVAARALGFSILYSSRISV
jgi:hypothetical protein